MGTSYQTTWGVTFTVLTHYQVSIIATEKMSKDWNHGTCGCFDDLGTCCFGYFCGCCMIYSTAKDLDQSGWLYLALSCITPCIPIMMLRTKAREAYDIQGDQTNDALMACCCGFCSMVQTAQEVKEHKR